MLSEGLSHRCGLQPKGPRKLLLALPCMNKRGICVVDDFLDKIGDEMLALHCTGRFTDGQLVSPKSDSS